MDITYFFTGFPGFIATRLINRISLGNPSARFVLLVHPTQLERAKAEIKRLCTTAETAEMRFELVPGDITKANLGMDPAYADMLTETVNYVFHLAAIYDLAVPYDAAYDVNVTGTSHVNNWVRHLRKLIRYVYFSTAYVSGDREGPVLETELEKGQSFKNHYEATKYMAEVLVQRERETLPVTIIRPGIVMGDSRTGETAKFDGPYFIMRFLHHFRHWPIPYIGKGEVPINLVPVDYVVDAVDYLAHSPVAVDKVYHLTDPHPLPVRQAYELIMDSLLAKRPKWTLPLPAVRMALSIPSFRRWVGVERETLAYFRCRAEYDNTIAAADLLGGGIECPPLSSYIDRCVTYFANHLDDPDKRIVVN
jgi:thioester reductase-like protein